MPKKSTYSTPKSVIKNRLDKAGSIGGKKGGGNKTANRKSGGSKKKD